MHSGMCRRHDGDTGACAMPGGGVQGKTRPPRSCEMPCLRWTSCAFQCLPSPCVVISPVCLSQGFHHRMRQSQPVTTEPQSTVLPKARTLTNRKPHCVYYVQTTPTTAPPTPVAPPHPPPRTRLVKHTSLLAATSPPTQHRLDARIILTDPARCPPCSCMDLRTGSCLPTPQRAADPPQPSPAPAARPCSGGRCSPAARGSAAAAALGRWPLARLDGGAGGVPGPVAHLDAV